jgi:hypothetical protein
MAHCAIIFEDGLPFLGVPGGRCREGERSGSENDSKTTDRDDSLFHIY